MVSFPDLRPILLFSERKKLAAMFEKWADENNAAKSPENVVAYLHLIRVIDVEKAREAIRDRKG